MGFCPTVEMDRAAVSARLTREHREPGLTDWNATLWVDRVTQDKNNRMFHLCPIAL